MQSLCRQGKVRPRADGHADPARHTAERPSGAPQTLEIVPRFLTPRVGAADDAPIQQVFQVIASDAVRTAQVADEVTAAFAAGAKVLVLTERTEHLDALRQALGRVSPLLVLHGRMSAKLRTTLLQELEALPADAPRVLLSTGELVGEGFDHAPLDTLVLEVPISWKGTLAQYAARLHREHASKSSVATRRAALLVQYGAPIRLPRPSLCCGQPDGSRPIARRVHRHQARPASLGALAHPHVLLALLLSQPKFTRHSLGLNMIASRLRRPKARISRGMLPT